MQTTSNVAVNLDGPGADGLGACSACSVACLRAAAYVRACAAGAICTLFCAQTRGWLVPASQWASLPKSRRRSVGSLPNLSRHARCQTRRRRRRSRVWALHCRFLFWDVAGARKLFRHGPRRGTGEMYHGWPMSGESEGAQEGFPSAQQLFVSSLPGDQSAPGMAKFSRSETLVSCTY